MLVRVYPCHWFPVRCCMHAWRTRGAESVLYAPWSCLFCVQRIGYLACCKYNRRPMAPCLYTYKCAVTGWLIAKQMFEAGVDSAALARLADKAKLESDAVLHFEVPVGPAHGVFLFWLCPKQVVCGGSL